MCDTLRRAVKDTSLTTHIANQSSKQHRPNRAEEDRCECHAARAHTHSNSTAEIAARCLVLDVLSKVDQLLMQSRFHDDLRLICIDPTAEGPKADRILLNIKLRCTTHPSPISFECSAPTTLTGLRESLKVGACEGQELFLLDKAKRLLDLNHRRIPTTDTSCTSSVLLILIKTLLQLPHPHRSLQ